MQKSITKVLNQKMTKQPKGFSFFLLFFYARTIVRDSDNTELVHLKKED